MMINILFIILHGNKSPDIANNETVWSSRIPPLQRLGINLMLLTKRKGTRYVGVTLLLFNIK